MCVLKIITFRFTLNYNISFYNSLTFRFGGLITSLKRPHIVVTWKESVRKSLGDIKVEVDNPARKKLKETEEKPAGGGGGQPHP